MRLPEVLRLIPVSRSTIYNMVQAGDFPRQVRMSRNCVGWKLSDVRAWMIQKEVDQQINALEG